MKKIAYIGFALFLLVACQKDKEQSNIVPDGVPDLKGLQKEYKEALVASEDGWFVNYKPEEDIGAISILMKFHADGTVSIKSDYQGFTEEQDDIKYRVGGYVFPRLVFETYSVWHALFENIGGDFEFRMDSVSKDRIVLSDTEDGKNPFQLRKATPADEDIIDNHVKTIETLNEFTQSNTAYFKNFITDNFDASWDLDAEKRRISLSWRSGGEKQGDTSLYTIVNGGIALIPPITSGSITIDTIYFGAVQGSNLEIKRAGNAGSGSISVADTPAIPYQGAADYFYNSLPDRMQGNIQGGLDDVSENLQQEFNYMADNIPGFKVVQFYIYPPSSSSSNYMAALYNPGDGNKWPAFYSDVSIIGEDSFKFTLKSKNSYGTTYSQYIEPFYNKLFTDKGVTIVPLDNRVSGRQQIRLVSREDSRNYVTLQLWAPSGYYYEH